MKKFFTLIATAFVALAANAQISWSVEKGATYDDDQRIVNNDYATIRTIGTTNANVFADEAENPTPKTINGVTFPAYVKVRVENLPNKDNSWAAETSDGCIAIKVIAKKNTDLEIYARYGATKSITVTDITAQGTVATKNSYEQADADNLLAVAVAQLQAEHTYVVSMKGGTMGLCGLNTAEGTYVAPSNFFYANTSASTVDGFSTMVYGDGAKVALVGNSGKSYSNGSDITINGSKYKTTKVSNGAQNKFIAPEGKAVCKAVIWSYVNKDDKTERPCFWQEINGIKYALEAAEGVEATTEMTSYKDMANPDAYEYDLPNVKEFTFTNTGEQACFVLEVTYADPAGITNVTTAAPAKVIKTIENGQLVIKTAKGTFSVAGAQMK